MPDTVSDSPHPSSFPDSEKIGIILVNLGTPDAPSASAIRHYLKSFLSDPRVIETPRWIWWCILNLIILPLRPRKLVKTYQRIWNSGESPIRQISLQQVKKLQQKLDHSLPKIITTVISAMSYGNPSFDHAFDKLAKAGINKVMILPLYPQYSATTTAATFDALARSLKLRRNIPAIHFIRSYHTHPLYIQGLAQCVRTHWKSRGRKATLLMSFHGIPKGYAEKGDPYPMECEATAKALAKTLGLTREDWILSYQSRIGAAEWLQPYTDVTMKQLGTKKLKGLDVICPGFSSDCLETLEEINIENRYFFESSGGTDFHYIPALNASDDQIRLIEALVTEPLQ